jgi:hypothetical protein
MALAQLVEQCGRPVLGRCLHQNHVVGLRIGHELVTESIEWKLHLEVAQPRQLYYLCNGEVRL